MERFPLVCAAIQYAVHTTQPIPHAWVQLRDQLYDALILEADLNFKIPADVPWDALDSDEQEYARQAFLQLSQHEHDALKNAPSSITPWWSAFFFSS